MIATAMRPLRTAHQDRVGCAEQRVRVPIAGHDGFARRMIHTRVEPVHEVLAAVPGTRILTSRSRPMTRAHRLGCLRAPTLPARSGLARLS